MQHQLEENDYHWKILAMSDVRNFALFNCFVYKIMGSKILMSENLSSKI